MVTTLLVCSLEYFKLTLVLVLLTVVTKLMMRCSLMEEDFFIAYFLRGYCLPRQEKVGLQEAKAFGHVASTFRELTVKREGS